MISGRETLSLVGESGCGKSTTGRALLRLVETREAPLPSTVSGSIPRRRQAAGSAAQYSVYFQDPASLDPRQTVGDSIMEPLRVHGLLRGKQRVSGSRLLKRVGLQPEHAALSPCLSGGQRQRMHCPRAGAESEGGDSRRVGVGPDVSIRAQIINLMLDLQREMGIAFLFISHDMAVVERISHRVAVMYRGRIVEIGPRRAVFETRSTPIPVSSWPPYRWPTGHRHPQRVLLSDDVPGNYKRARRSPACRCSRSGRATSSPANPPMCWAEHNNT